MRKFEIKVSDRKKNESQEFFQVSKNLPELIDSLLVDLKLRKLNLGIWFNQDMSYGEIITLDDDFIEKDFITIIEKEKL